MPADLPFSQDAPFDLPRAHRWLAVEFNNIAWDLFEAGPQSAAEIERMIHTAHAAAIHWSQAGDAVNQLRAAVLVAHAYARAEMAESALHWAQRCLALSAECEGRTPFDRATSLGVAAWAQQLAGNAAEAASLMSQAREAAAALTHPDEQKLFAGYYAHIAPPAS